MIIFNVDLDNTLIYSYKHDLGKDKICAEIYQEREISFVTPATRKMLHELNKRICIVPTTTRTIEQYQRIFLGLENNPYALVCNGGILLENGKENAAWYQESLRRIAPCNEELLKAVEMLEQDTDICFEIRFIRELFIFTKSNKPEDTVARLLAVLNTELVDVFHNGIKVYVVPKALSKGEGINRLREQLSADYVIAAGDSEFDQSMLQNADMGIAPASLPVHEGKHVVHMDENMLFSDALLMHIMKVLPEIEKETDRRKSEK